MTVLAVLFTIVAAWFALRGIIVIARIASDRPTPGSPFMILLMVAYFAWLAYISFTGATFMFVVAMLMFGMAFLWLAGTWMNLDGKTDNASKVIATGVILMLVNIILGLIALDFA